MGVRRRRGWSGVLRRLIEGIIVVTCTGSMGVAGLWEAIPWSWCLLW